MSIDVSKAVESIGLVPVVVIDDAADAVPAALALKAGGVPVMEITLRTAAGLDAIEAVAKDAPDVLVGAGTVLTLEKAMEAYERGAQYIVSPGFDPKIVSWCVENDVSIFPGCVTPTEITAAIGMSLKVVKFFPANIYGGIKAIKALAGPFPDIRFMPTGGVDLSNLKDYVIPEVIAVGGGWLCARKDIKEKQFGKITEICSESVNVVKQCKETSSQ